MTASLPNDKRGLGPRGTTHIKLAVGALALVVASAGTMPAEAQDVREFPLAPIRPQGNFVAPYFDGFLPNDDGSWTLSFGFMNRNDEELIEIPLGPNNFLEPPQFDGSQPTTFPVVRYEGFGGPRERGAFAVVVPADFQGDVWWHLTSPNGFSTKVPGRLIQPGALIPGAYELSVGPQGGGSMRPSVRFSPDGPMGIGPLGIFHPETFRTSVGRPITVTAWVEDRGERELRSVNMTLWKHQGPVGGEILFESLVPQSVGGPGQGPGQEPGGGGPEGRSIQIPREGEKAHLAQFTASFSQPGDYVIRVRIDNFGGGDSSPGNMCCWTNGYVRVTVTP
ncbi:MAG: hypothetical protein EXR92_04515 [Gemmatimonadetes bacterium]|nr:hypothetical protein [Gemmatimonadota bacterium]